MTDEEILDYIKTKEQMDKAGAYGIQGRFAAFVSKIEGDYNSVVGLPERLFIISNACLSSLGLPRT